MKGPEVTLRFLQKGSSGGWVLSLLYCLWSFGLFPAVLMAFKWLFPWTFLRLGVNVGIPALLITLILWTVTNRIIIGRWLP